VPWAGPMQDQAGSALPGEAATTTVGLGQWAAMSRSRGLVSSLLTGPVQVGFVVGWATEAAFGP
jgi:hypothetical protein